MAEVNPEKRASAADMLDMLVRYHKKTESPLQCNNIYPRIPVDQPFRMPVEKRPFKAEKNRINRKRRQVPLGKSVPQGCDKFVVRIPGAFPVGIGQ